MALYNTRVFLNLTHIRLRTKFADKMNLGKFKQTEPLITELEKKSIEGQVITSIVYQSERDGFTDTKQ